MALSPTAIAEKGEKIYRDRYKDEFERIHLGKFVAIEIDSGEAYVGSSPEEAISSAQKAYEGGLFHLIRIGAPGVYRVGYYGGRDWLN